MKFLAMDFGGTFVKYCLMDEDANMSENGQYPAPLSSEEEWVDSTVTLYEKYKGQVDGVAISLPGVVDCESGYLYSAGAYTGTMKNKNVYDLLKDKIDVPVSIENDAKSAILAEAWKGSLDGVKTGCACIVGSGLGGGIIMDGKLQKGEHFAAGEISGLIVEAGNYSLEGCAAFAAGASALLMNVAKAKNMPVSDFEVSGFMAEQDDTNKKKIGGREVIQWVEDGDEVTKSVYDKWIQNLVMVLFNMKMMIDPEKIVIGGGISRNPKFMTDVQNEWDKSNSFTDMFGMPHTKIEPCKFTSDANLVGAAYAWILLHQK